ncbi:SOS response-associated peptidase [Deinococcus altitudinis]|uniref:SOS response-associated peptidase n=1 Tax=Deinococcus altitudinis TaxID=468914 RepID=UPI0038919973
MCGRAWQSITGAEMKRLFGVDLPVGFVPRYNLAPTQELLMVYDDDGRQARMARWGLIASPDQPKTLSTFNARAETVDRSPVFREAFRTRRALIPISGAYEWIGEKKDRRPLAITRADGKPLVCAGLWNELDGVTSCTILTTAPAGLFTEIHDRMPLLLPQDRWAAWLNPATSLAAVQSLLAPHDLHRALHAYPVDPAVGNVRNDRAEFILPLSASLGA